jgi:polysaccharide export outer membrane protein
MNLSPKNVSLLVVYALLWGLPVCAAQSQAASPVTKPASGIQPVVAPASVSPAQTDSPAPPVETPASIGNTAAPADKAKVAAANSPAAFSKSTVASPSASQKRYVIGPLDVLYIKVWNQPQLSGPVDVRPDGILSMPLIGEVKADGLTASQLKEAIQTRLSDFLNNPEVDVGIAKINSKRYFVYGGVGHPGEFPLVQTTTIMDALSQVGGFRDFAKQNKITIQRGTQTFHFNYKDFSKGKNVDKNANIEIQNGDRIYVPE